MGLLYPVLVLIVVTCLAPAAQAQGSASRDKRPNAEQAQPDRTKPASPNKKKPAAAVSPFPKPLSMPPRDNATRRIAPVPMEAFAAETDPQPPAEAVAAKPDEPSACLIRVSNKVAVIEPLPSISGPGDCGATDVVRLEAIIQPDKSRVAVSPPATMRCTMAEAVAVWVREDLTATAAQFGAAPQALDNYASYDCRGRNRVAGARISQHGLANAIDIRGLRLSDGRFVSFTDRKVDRGFREAVRKTTCERFTTVLGPGSDGHHEDHIHMDLAERRGGYRLCQWNVLDPAGEIPLPRPRPKEAS